MRETFFQPKKNATESEQHEKVTELLYEAKHFVDSLGNLIMGIKTNLDSNTTIKQDEKKQANFDLIYENVKTAKLETTRLCANYSNQEITTSKQDELTGSFKKT